MSDFNIPESWAETTLGNLVKILDNLRKPITAKDRKEGPYPYYGANGIQGYHNEYIFDEKLLLVAEDGGHFGSKTRDIAYIIEGKSWVNNHAHVLKNVQGVSLEYLFQYLRRFDVKPWVTGATVPKLNQAKLRELPVVLPPSKEQERIEKKIESCFAKIETTEVNLNKVEALLEKYRKSILAKAFRGELVLQDPSEGTGHELLNKIFPSYEIIQCDQRKSNIPESWALSDFDTISTRKGGGTPSRANKEYFKGYIPWITVADIPKEIFDVFVIKESRESITNEAIKESSTNLIPEGSVILSTRVSVGKIGINSVPLCTNQDFSSFTNIKINNKFFAYFLLKINSELIASSKGTTIKGINLSDLQKIKVPIPALKEQERIVQKIELCFKKIDAIRKAVVEKRKLLAKTKESILAKAFEGRLVEQIPSEGTGHELLAKILAEKESTQNSELNEKSKKTIKKASAKKAVATKGK